MESCDVIIVGGGPAGSTAAWQLKKAGADVLVLDQAEFPRLKLCAGWVTPEALEDLELDADDYPASFMTFDRLHVHWKFLTLKPPTKQHSIRRYEFDEFLLRRSGARVLQHKVRDIRQDGDAFIVDDRFRAGHIIGAAGTSCPVYRTFFSDRHPRNHALQTATWEQEFPYDWDDPACHLWFFDDGLPGYAWYVPKANGHINVGLGGMAVQLKSRSRRLQDYWRRFVGRLATKGLVRHEDFNPKGYSYFLRDGMQTVQHGNACLIGDAAGLATRDLCEGIGPAVRSGRLAARSIVDGVPYTLDSVATLSGSGTPSRLLERRFAGTSFGDN